MIEYPIVLQLLLSIWPISSCLFYFLSLSLTASQSDTECLKLCTLLDPKSAAGSDDCVLQYKTFFFFCTVKQRNNVANRQREGEGERKGDSDTQLNINK